LNAQHKHPNSAYSQGLKNLVDCILKINPKTDRIFTRCVSLLIDIYHTERMHIGHSNDRQSPTVAVVGRDIIPSDQDSQG